MKEKYLPIGTVVMLKGGKKRVMIAGYFAVDNKNTEVVYDYSGCLFPEGFLSSDQTLLFNHSQIEKVYFEGYQDEDQQLFSKQLLEIEKELNVQNEVQSVDTLNIPE